MGSDDEVEAQAAHPRRRGYAHGRRSCRAAAGTEAARSRRLMPARLDIIGKLLRPVAGCAGRDQQAAERDLPLRLDGVGELLLAKRQPQLK